MSMLTFCLNCASYTEQLEVCVFCELSQKQSALKTTETSSDPMFRLSNNLKTFPIRWQCADRDKRLIEQWVHRKSGNSDDHKWKRGCEHLKSRVSYCSLRTGDEHCGFNAKALVDIPRHGSALRLATMNLVFKILSAEVEKKIKCQRRKNQISKAIGFLKRKIRRYLMNLDPKPSDVQNSIENLKIEWNECLANCSCPDVWNSGNGSSRRKLGEFLKSNSNKCPTIGMMDEDDLSDLHLFFFLLNIL
ncbi:hypothetical protein GCK72_012106 [Caenorhabditis remanei]|uniref:Uncharacterized protein n=1 Tax=Caenorhabditis remanei TaxID=31234 RepID=A0A6A5GLZ0_CAERE|nr:hypothetical protein GCK72_012106 [Caenorhabditis remanei]KAF1755656.1 hypothetical protein GCK72_012106 [Caenorhabditis remanei]